MQTARDQLAELEIEGLKVSHKNTELAAEALQLAGKNHEQSTENVKSERFRRDIATLEEQAKASRHRWRIIKGATSAIVAGSGIDWVRDGRLRDFVLDASDQ